MYTLEISRYNAILHITQQLWLWADFELAKDIPHLKDELWNVCRELSEEMWPPHTEGELYELRKSNELRKPLG